MSRVIEKKTIQQNYEQCVARECDLCHAKSPNPDGWENNWIKGDYTLEETELTIAVRHKDGYSCPDGGNGTEYEIDLCPKCFKERLIPWLKSQGATVERKDWDW
jgi:hypothetical protein